MKIFELHFNPKSEQGSVFETSSHKPVNVSEKRGGTIFLAGELEKSIPENKSFLQKLNEFIIKSYYNKIKNPEKSLSETLKKTNQYLAEQIKKENVHWLGNLNFTIGVIKNSEFFLTQTGNNKAFLIREGEITDISQNFDNQEIEPYPLKVFLSIISGQLAENDFILILNQEIYNIFKEENVLEKIKKLKDLNDDVLKEIIPKSIKNKRISGFALLILLKNNQNNTKKIIKKKSNNFKSLISRKKELLKIPSLLKRKFSRKKVILIILLFSIIFIGFSFHRKEKEQEQKTILYFEQKISETKNLEIKESNIILQNLLNETSDKEIIKEIEKNLQENNNLLIIENPELLINFEEKIENIVFVNDELYFIFPEKICSLEKNCLSLTSKLATNYLNGIISFSSPEKISFIEDKEIRNITIPFYKFNFDQIYSYYNNLYFLDKENCHIISYYSAGSFQWQKPEVWLNKNEPCQDLAIDGSIWILNKNSVDLFYKKEFIENFKIETFPEVQELKQIKTNKELDYLYFLEPKNQRIIITDKRGQIIKQYQSKLFNNPTNFEISPNGETIWLINNNKVYKIKAVF